MADGGYGNAPTRRHHDIAGGRLVDMITMAHPHARCGALGKTVEQIGVAVDDQISRTILAPIGAAGFAAEVEIDDTHAVADAKKRHRQLKKRRVNFGRAILVNARRSAGKDDSFGIERAHFVQREVKWMDFAVYLGLADAPRDQLGILRPEIENENHSTR